MLQNKLKATKLIKVKWEKIFSQYGGTLKYPIGKEKRVVFHFLKVTLILGDFRVSKTLDFGVEFEANLERQWSLS